MKRGKKTASIMASAFISLCFLVGCGESVSVGNTLLLDKDVKPEQTAVYEEYSNQVLADYFAVAEKHMVDGDIDYDNEEVQAVGVVAAAKLFAYACYNERQLDKYVFFASQEGETDISAGSATAMKQEYFLRVNESEDTCGYRYHYTIKYVSKSSGAISMFKSAFESARTRITDKTDLLYRLEGSNIRVGETTADGIDMLECDWETGSDWGEKEVRMVKRAYVEPDAIEQDIIDSANMGDVKGVETVTIRANINILADNMVKEATIFKDVTEENGFEGYGIVMIVDTEVANKDEASLKMLRQANGSDDCEWVSDGEDSGLVIFFRLWPNGLFRTYSVAEKWQGKISGFSGTADSSTSYVYSYSDRDCDMTKYLETLEAAKKSKG